MSMKKAILIASIVAVVISFALSVYAHSGKTDANGGHIDYDTGEYHYHHGYPAHDHYDIDEDGDLDCPYDFDDRTGVNSGSNSTSSTYYSDQPSNDDNVIIKTEVVTKTVTKEVPYIPSWVYWVFASQFIIVLVLLIVNRGKKQDIKNMVHSHKIEVDQIKQSCDRQLAERSATDKDLHRLRSCVLHTKKEYEELQGKIAHEKSELEKTKILRSRMKGAPLDIYFSPNGLPIYWKPNMYKPYGDYTVYVNKKSNIYHVDRKCASYNTSETHIFYAIENTKPCKKCAEGFFQFTTIPEWFVSGDIQRKKLGIIE